MTSIVIVEKNGDLKEKKVREFDVDNLYKKCGFRQKKNFEKQTTWLLKSKGDKIKIALYGKDEGSSRANNENKYDFPPPVDSKLFFGNCILVKYDENNNVQDLVLSEWKKMYEHLFGGFEDLNDTIKEDENEEDELDDIPKEMKTKQGYLKDGFVVDANSEELTNSSPDDYEEELNEDEEETDEDSFECDDTSSEEEDNSELEEEEFLYSDED
jgi:hypothetical protein